MDHVSSVDLSKLGLWVINWNENIFFVNIQLDYNQGIAHYDCNPICLTVLQFTTQS